MITLDYKHDDLGILKYKIPTDLSEVTYSKYLDFVYAKKGYHDLDKPDQAKEALNHLLKAVSILVEGPVQNLAMGTDAEGVKDLIDGHPGFVLDGELTIMSLYGFFIHLINNQAEPKIEKKGYRVMYKGKEYWLSGSNSRAVVTGQYFTAGEVITIEATRQWANNMTEQKGPMDGAFDFTMDLRTVAAILRPLAFELPVNQREREAYLEEMAKHFEEIPTSVVLDIRFFLLSTLIEYLKTETLQSYSTESPKSMKVVALNYNGQKVRPKGQREKRLSKSESA